MDGVAEQALALPQRQAPNVVPVEMQHIEHVVEHSDAGCSCRDRIGQPQTALQALETGPPADERHDLAVQHRGDLALARHRVGDLGVGAFQRLVVARAQSHLA